MSRRPSDEEPPAIDLAAALGVLMGALFVAAMFWWPLILYSWHWWLG